MEAKHPVSSFIEKHFRHFNAASLVDAAKEVQRVSDDFTDFIDIIGKNYAA